MVLQIFLIGMMALAGGTLLLVHDIVTYANAPGMGVLFGALLIVAIVVMVVVLFTVLISLPDLFTRIARRFGHTVLMAVLLAISLGLTGLTAAAEIHGGFGSLKGLYGITFLARAYLASEMRSAPKTHD